MRQMRSGGSARAVLGTALGVMLCGTLPAAEEAPAALFAPLSDAQTVELPELDPRVPSPAGFLGYPLGARFTHYARIVAYLERLAAASERVEMWRIGSTYEGRPLHLLAIGSPANIARLEEIRSRQLELAAGKLAAKAEEGMPVVVWLGYGVHGNESSSAEAAMATAYALAAGEGEWAARLDEVVVLIDPLTNPDGRERYVHFFETRRGRVPDPLPDAAEHVEPWPGGRQNHYLIDLNRDWAWATQRETQARLAAYRRWEPQVFVDLHEMGAESTYFFPPAADPIHPGIDPRNVHWLEVFGRGNAAAFDRLGWSYYVGERFDLFYPGYGDSYPSLRGAVGMTYEMAGHGTAGQAVKLAGGGLLTLADRVARHFTTSLATVATAATHRRQLLGDFAERRRKAVAGPGRTYLWEAGQPEAVAAGRLLERHGIAVEELAAEAELEARPVKGGRAERRKFPPGTFAARTVQPLGALLRALMELEAPMEPAFIEEQRRRIEQHREAEFYDITAWSLPLAFSLDVWTVPGGAPATRPAGFERGGLSGEGRFGYLVAPQGVDGYRLAAALLAERVPFRLATAGFRTAGRGYPAGTLFVPRRPGGEDLEATVERLARAGGVRVERVASAYVEEGVSLGSDSMVAIAGPTVGLVIGEGTSPTSVGAIWHLLDQELRMPHHRLDVASLRRVDLDRFDLLILPSGRYGRHVDEMTTENLADWVERGGILVGVGRAVAWMKQKELAGVETWKPPRDEEKAKPNEVVEITPANRPLFTPGAALASEIRRPHPLTSGLAAPPAVLFQGSSVLLASGDPRRDLLTAAREDPVLAGFAWPEAAERLAGALLVGLQPKGKGAVVLFAQEPAFRLFWRATAPVFLNTVLYAPSLNERGRLWPRVDPYRQ